MIYVFLVRNYNDKSCSKRPSTLMSSGQRQQYYFKEDVNYIQEQPACVTPASLLATLVSDASIFSHYSQSVSFHNTDALHGKTAKHEQLQGVQVVNKMLFHRTIKALKI